MRKEISTDARLSQVYSNHCVRSTSDSHSFECRRDSYLQINHANFGPRNETSVKFYCDRQTLEKELTRFGNELLAAEHQMQELEEDRAQQTPISSQVRNNIVANVNHSRILNLLQPAEFNNCNITLNCKSSK